MAPDEGFAIGGATSELETGLESRFRAGPAVHSVQGHSRHLRTQEGGAGWRGDGDNQPASLSLPRSTREALGSLARLRNVTARCCRRAAVGRGA
jgi:hypothetical protein